MEQCVVWSDSENRKTYFDLLCGSMEREELWVSMGAFEEVTVWESVCVCQCCVYKRSARSEGRQARTVAYQTHQL